MIMIDQATVTRVEETVAARSDGAFLSGTQPHADTLHFKIEKRAMRAVVEALGQRVARALHDFGGDGYPIPQRRLRNFASVFTGP